MATVTLYPLEIYRYRPSDKVITEKLSFNSSTVISNNEDQDRFLIIWDVSGINQYGQVTGGSGLATINYQPPGSDLNRYLYFQNHIVQDIVVGQTFGELESDPTYINNGTFRMQSGKYVTLDNYGRLCTTFRAFVSLTFSRECKFSNLRLQLTIGSAGAFTALSDYGGGYQDRTKALAINLSAEYNATIFRQHEVASGSIKYKLTSASSYSSISFTGNTATVPANTFASGQTYDLYVACTSKAGSTSNTPAVRVSTVDGTAVAVPVSPNNAVANGNVTFVWAYSNETGSSQYAYDLQISTNNGSSWSTIKNHVVTPATSTTYTQSSSGTTLWRVRAYNQNNVAGAWSNAASYVNNVPPSAPTGVSVTGAGRQTVAWTSSQVTMAYQVQVLNSSGTVVYDTGQVYSAKKTALINEYLESGTYVFKVRITTSVGLWSEWASAQKTIAPSLASPTVTISATDEGALIDITTSGTYTHYYILRDGIPIADVTGPFIDKFTVGNATYRVIGVNASDAYGYTTMNFHYAPRSSKIIKSDGTEIMVNKRWRTRSYAVKQIRPRYGTSEYLGERFPTHHMDSDGRAGSFTVSAFDEFNTFDELLGSPVFFACKDDFGGWCIVTGITRTEQICGNETVIVMEFDSYKERIEYAV